MIGESQQNIHKSPSLQAESAGGTGGPSKSPSPHSEDAEDGDGYNEHHGLSGDKDHGSHQDTMAQTTWNTVEVL